VECGEGGEGGGVEGGAMRLGQEQGQDGCDVNNIVIAQSKTSKGGGGGREGR